MSVLTRRGFFGLFGGRATPPRAPSAPPAAAVPAPTPQAVAPAIKTFSLEAFYRERAARGESPFPVRAPEEPAKTSPVSDVQGDTE